MGKPAAYSAATTAAVISRKLRRAGYVMSVRDERKRWSEGYYVHRVGYGHTVAIGYRMPSGDYSAASRARMWQAERRAREWAVEQGYSLDGRFSGGCYVRCEAE